MNDDQIRFEYARNIATNGRLFSILLVVISLTIYANGAGKVFALYAILSALPVGLACIVDQMERTAKALASIVLYLFTALVALALLISIVG